MKALIALTALAGTLAAASAAAPPAAADAAAAAAGGAAPAAVGWEDVNRAAGAQLFADGSLWDDAAAAAAERLGLAVESESATLASYRSYPGAETLWFGARPYSISLQARDGKPVSLFVVFANLGDFGGLAAARESLAIARGAARTDLKKKIDDAERGLDPAIRHDADAVAAAFDKLLGGGARGRGSTLGQVRERGAQWEWSGHEFFVAEQRGAYVALRITPAAAAGAAAAAAEPGSRAEFRAELRRRVVKRENGDVVIGGMPMVDQGEKGFCVPATLDRVLRYLGVPSDMYLLAVACGTQAGGGTKMDDVVAGLRRHLKDNRRDLETAGGGVQPRAVAKWIDDGIPVLWLMRVNPEFDAELTARAAQRRDTADPKAWKEVLKAARKQWRRIETGRDAGHLCLIVGYNEATDELAISDSWGPEFAERWLAADEAKEITAGGLFVVR